jgi:transglutaminase-like putative cysteine protease
MKLKIKKESFYNYAEPVSLSPHHARIFPRVDLFVKIEKVVFETAPGADVQYRQDLFDNLIAYCFYPKTTHELPFRLELDLEVKEKNPFHFLLESTGFKIPPEYRPDHAEILGPYLRPEGGCKLPDPLAPTAPRLTVETLLNFNHWIYENIAYESRQVGKPFTPAETLKKGAGSCRDFAALLVEALRQNGVAARLASGFVWEGDKAEEDKRASSAMHLWVEACLPGAGWIGMDPTNGVLTDHHFVTTAVGHSHEDVSPISGVFYSSKPVENNLTTILSVEKVA